MDIKDIKDTQDTNDTKGTNEDRKQYNAMDEGTEAEPLLPPPPPDHSHSYSHQIYQESTYSSHDGEHHGKSSELHDPPPYLLPRDTSRAQDLHRLRQSWSTTLEEREHTLHRKRNALEAYESKLTSEALRLRQSTEMIKFQHLDLETTNSQLVQQRIETVGREKELHHNEQKYNHEVEQLNAMKTRLTKEQDLLNKREKELGLYEQELGKIAGDMEQERRRDEDVRREKERHAKQEERRLVEVKCSRFYAHLTVFFAHFTLHTLHFTPQSNI
jgi:DNA repair exonuclease SbcCD ATPase subunit